MANRSTALITGASSGIGRALALLFARDGYDVVLVARRADALEALAAEIAGTNTVTARAVPLDLARPSGPQDLFDELQRNGVTVDALVNNAGFGLQGAFVDLPLPRQVEMINLNVTTLTALTRLFVPAMMERARAAGGQGAPRGVLNVGSTAAYQPGPYMAVYYATKAYVVSFSEALANELRGSGLRVSCLAPGPTVTEFAEAAGATRARLFQGPMMGVEEVARIGFDGWKSGRPVVIAGARNRWIARMVRFAPRSILLDAVRRLNTAR
jgi:short-subunit dehydrogenase